MKRRAGGGCVWPQTGLWLTSTSLGRVVAARVFSDDDGKIIMPGNFIEIAESLGLIQELGMRVVEKLLLDMGAQYGQGYLFRQPMPLGGEHELGAVGGFSAA